MMENIDIKCERTIPASPNEVFDTWLDPKIPGTPFHENEKVIINPMVDGLWYWLSKGQPHFGRFMEFQRPARIRHSWMSRKTLGEETVVTVTFHKKGDGTLMTLVHSGFASGEVAQPHEKAWNLLLGRFAGIFGRGTQRQVTL
jgi:uncharacterized protein YndB with AHSA1/START domain